MTPRCEVIGDCTLWLADCRDVLANIAADVLICDPPYGVEFHGKVTKYTHNRPTTTYADTPAYFEMCVLPAITQALTVVQRGAIFCGVRQLYAYPPPHDIGGIICPNGGGRSPWGFGCYNPVLFYGRSPYMAAGLGGRPTATSMYHPGMHVTGEASIKHPCPKPLAFMEWAIHTASLPGETVVDIFAGSGTTGVACVKMGRRFIGVEIDEAYWAESCRRIEAAYRQPDLFVEHAKRQVATQQPLFAQEQRHA